MKQMAVLTQIIFNNSQAHAQLQQSTLHSFAHASINLLLQRASINLLLLIDFGSLLMTPKNSGAIDNGFVDPSSPGDRTAVANMQKLIHASNAQLKCLEQELIYALELIDKLQSNRNTRFVLFVTDGDS